VTVREWVFTAAVLVAAVAVVVWLRVTGHNGPRPLDGTRLPRWLRDLGRRVPRRAVPDVPADLATITRRVLDEVIGLGDKTMRDRSLIIPHRVDVHVNPADAAVVQAHRAVIERDIHNEIVASGARERWVSEGSLRIVHIIEDVEIPAGRPMVQRAVPAPSVEVRDRPGATAWVLVGPDGARYPVPTDGGRIGRDPDACAVVVDRSTVSREHALLRPRSSGLEIVDLDSANGVSVDGVRVREAQLRPGQTLGLGRSVELRLDHSTGPTGTEPMANGRPGRR
jgi:hypothetical protein